MKKLATVVALVAVYTTLAVTQLLAQQTQFYPDVLNELKHDTSLAMRDIHAASPDQGPPRIIQRMLTPHRINQGQFDPVVQTSASSTVTSYGALNANGVSSTGLSPADANGAAGATQYVQWVNANYAVFAKATGAMILGPVAGNTLWTGFGAPCETTNAGDPIAQYDKAANRWLMAQPVYGSPYVYCVAVSTTSDATGSYNRYAFSMPYIPDYPKLGVWPDAYYGSINLFQGNSFMGAYACAFDRNAMLAGKAATAQCFTTSTSQASLLPSDLDGLTPPPAGSPDYFVNFGTNALNLWKFHVDFTNSANTTFTGPTSIPVAPFNEACGTVNLNGCIQQPLYQGYFQEPLDSLGDRLMYRLAYRNFGDHEALVVSHSVDPGNGTSAIRWYELRSPRTSPTVYQQGTYAPDANFRWMPSIAMDHAGDIAVGYSVASTSLNPSIRYAGRVPTDPLGTLEAENSIFEGSFEQINNVRWGDYTSMSVDPVDDCTFWYTNQLATADTSTNWGTRIASFKFPNCASAPSADFGLTASPASQTVTQGNGANYSVSISPLNGFTGSVSFSTGGLPLGVTASFNPTASASSTTLTLTAASSTPTGTYTITVNGLSGSLSHTLSLTLVVNAAPPGGDFSIAASPASLTVSRGSNGSYTITVTALSGFTGSVSLSVSGLPGRTNARFSPSTIAGSGASTLTLAPNKKVSPGTYPVTITGTSGSLTHSATVSLTIN
ncbi:MAG TPA: hypothetical protein VG204_03170 [Terriglobia bacterium]|nr:hypothetical protein [Terriglobia bacterium]